MEILEYFLLAVGVFGLVVGYSKNSRNVLLASALVLSLGFGIADFSSGFHGGWQRSTAHKFESSA